MLPRIYRFFGIERPENPLTISSFHNMDQSKLASPVSGNVSPITWKDGRRFAPRVQVCTASDRFIFRVHAQRAWRYCKAGIAEVDPDGRRISRIILVSTPSGSLKKAPPTVPSIRSYSTRSYVHLEVLGFTDTGRLSTYTLEPSNYSDRRRLLQEILDDIAQSKQAKRLTAVSIS